MQEKVYEKTLWTEWMAFKVMICQVICQLELSPTKRSLFYLLQWKPFKKLFPFLRYSNFCLDFFVMRENGLLRKKAKINLKIHDVTTWEKDNYNTHIFQYLKM